MQVADAREAANEYIEQGRERAQELALAAEEKIRSQPTQALLVAAGVGFVLGLIWSRR